MHSYMFSNFSILYIVSSIPNTNSLHIFAFKYSYLIITIIIIIIIIICFDTVICFQAFLFDTNNFQRYQFDSY